jgi:hypothetical protein
MAKGSLAVYDCQLFLQAHVWNGSSAATCDPGLMYQWLNIRGSTADQSRHDRDHQSNSNILFIFVS